jgi:hypothetical protein
MENKGTQLLDHDVELLLMREPLGEFLRENVSIVEIDRKILSFMTKGKVDEKCDSRAKLVIKEINAAMEGMREWLEDQENDSVRKKTFN